MEKWNGRVALVTGAGSGNGAAMSRAMVKCGMKVVGADKNLSSVEALARELENEKGSFTPMSCDVTSDDEVYALFRNIKESHGGVDVCVNNAGFTHNSKLLEGNPKEWRAMTDVNMIAICLCTKLAYQSMKERGVDDGHIVNICSLAGYRLGNDLGMNFYCGTKFATRAITEGLRQEFREMNSHIRVSSISPGKVETRFYNVMKENEEEANKIYSSIKCLQSEDIATSLIHILSAPPHVEINDILVRPTEQRL